MTLKKILKIIDLKTLIASLIPVLYGTTYAWYKYDRIDYSLIVPLLVSMLMIQSATNMINDCSDYMSGADQRHVRIDEKILVSGELSVKQLAKLAIGFLIIAFIIGIYIASKSSYGILIVGLLGVTIALLYSMGPLPISYTPIGELVSGVTMGIGISSTVIYVVSGVVSLETILVALPPTLFIASILLSNNLSDIEVDKASGRRTLPILIGVTKSEYLWQANVLGIIFLSMIFVLLGIYPIGVILWMLPLFSYKNFKRFSTYEKNVQTKEITMKIIAVIGVRLHIGIVLGLILTKFMQ